MNIIIFISIAVNRSIHHENGQVQHERKRDPCHVDSERPWQRREKPQGGGNHQRHDHQRPADVLLPEKDRRPHQIQEKVECKRQARVGDKQVQEQGV